MLDSFCMAPIKNPTFMLTIPGFLTQPGMRHHMHFPKRDSTFIEIGAFLRLIFTIMVFQLAIRNELFASIFLILTFELQLFVQINPEQMRPLVPGRPTSGEAFISFLNTASAEMQLALHALFRVFDQPIADRTEQILTNSASVAVDEPRVEGFVFHNKLILITCAEAAPTLETWAWSRTRSSLSQYRNSATRSPSRSASARRPHARHSASTALLYFPDLYASTGISQ